MEKSFGKVKDVSIGTEGFTLRACIGWATIHFNKVRDFHECLLL